MEEGSMMRPCNWKQILILAISFMLLCCGRAQAQAPTITGIAPTSGPVGAPVTITGTNFGASQGSSTVSLNGTSAVATSWSNTTIAAVVPTGASTGTFTVTVNGQQASSSTFTVTALPSGWTDQDIGTVGLAGNASYATGVFTLNGAGAGIGGVYGYTTDAFHFAYQSLSGDGTIVARIVSTSNSNAQAGIMIRETLNANAKSMCVATYGNLIYTMFRTTTGGGASSGRNSGSPGLPYWVKLVRSGTSFSGYQSLDGLNWAQVGTSQTISMAQNVYVGLAMSSTSTGALYTGTIDSFSITTATNPAPAITSVSATTGSIGGQVVISGTGFGASSGSGVVLFNDKVATVSAWSATSITATVPSGATTGPLVVSLASGMNDSNQVDFTVTSTPLPSGWLDQDVGIVSKAGNAGYANGKFTIQTGSAGLSTFAAQDAFHFVYQPLSGDGTIVARVVNLPAAQAGVMIRETMDPSAKTVFVIEGVNGLLAYYRTLSGATPSYFQASLSYFAPPYWVKVQRNGSGFTVFYSPDGFDWTPFGSLLDISMAQNVYIGLAVGGGSANNPTTEYFDNVSVTSSSVTAPVIASLSTTTGPVGTQVVISGSGFGTSQGSSAVVLNDAPVTINSWSATSITITIPTGATSGEMAVLVGPSMDSSNCVAFTVTSSPLPSGWLDADIGQVGISGSASFANGIFTVQGSGVFLANYTDGFHFVYQPMNTSGTIIARVTGAGTYGAYGAVIMRETLDADAANISAGGYVGTTNASMYYRSFIGGYELTAGSKGLNLPYWLKVVRNANQFSAYAGADGVNWTQLGTTQTIITAQTVYVGFGVGSSSYARLDSATFDNVSVTLGASLPNPVVTGISPASGAPGTSVTISGSGFGATQGTSTVAFNGATTTTITSWSDSQIIAAVSDGASTGPIMVTVGGITGQSSIFTVNFAVQVTDSLGNQTTYVSSLAGGQYSYTNAQGSGCSSCTVRGTVQNSYDANGNVELSVDAMGNDTSYQYDSSNNLTSRTSQVNATTVATTQYAYNSFGEVLNTTDPLGYVTSNTYDTHGNLLTVTTPSPSPGVAGSVTTFTYDSMGELKTIKDPLNNVTTLAYFPTGLINTITDQQNNVTTYGYDTHGNRTSVTDALNHQTTFTYDAMDRLTKITYPDTTTTQFGYDYRGRRTTVTDQNGKVTTYAYDDADRLTSVTDASTPGNVTTYGYDTENNLTSIKDANNNTTSFTYDAFGRVTKTTFPSGYIETYGYDADNNLTAKTDRKNQQITYTYDQLNRLMQKTYPDSTTVNYTYDLNSRLTQVIDPTGTYAFTFDNMGRLTGTTTSYTFLTRNFTTSYAYDKASNRTGFTDPESGSTSYVYDTLNRLQTLTPPSAFSSSGNFGFSYDALSRRTQMTRPNGLSSIYAYDNLSRLLSVLHQSGSTTLDGATYGVDNAGNRTSRTPQPTGTASNYGYDAIYELTGVTQNSTTTESYTYDAVGNRLSSLGVSPYNVNTSNELTSTPSTTYTYDYNGNTLTKVIGSNTTSYAWDFENRLTSVTLPGSGGTVTFAYDPFGRRIKKVTPTTTSIYAYDGDNLVEETNSSGTVVARYEDTQNIDEPLAMLRSSATSYFHADGLGSVTSLSSSAGSIANTYTYDSFGKLTASTGSLVNPFQYTARESDPETSLYYYRARYYDTNSGRFISEDPIAFQAGSNFYTYVRNKPIIFSDPTGLLNFDASCNCSNGFKRPDLELADQWAQAAASNIDDPNLRSCVLDKLKNGTAKCGKKGCGNGSGGKRVTLGWAPPFGNTIHLCKAAGNSDLWLACTMVHEAAHTCGHPFEGTPKLAEKQAFGGICPQ
jgi:RHS repeat-associated protein